MRTKSHYVHYMTIKKENKGDKKNTLVMSTKVTAMEMTTRKRNKEERIGW